MKGWRIEPTAQPILHKKAVQFWMIFRALQPEFQGLPQLQLLGWEGVRAHPAPVGDHDLIPGFHPKVTHPFHHLRHFIEVIDESLSIG